MWLHRKRRWQTYGNVDLVIVATYVAAYDPARGVEVFEFSPAECMTALDAKRALNPTAHGPRFVPLDPVADSPGAGLATLRPPIASGSVLAASEIGAPPPPNQSARLDAVLRQAAELAAAEYDVPLGRVRVSIAVATRFGELVCNFIPHDPAHAADEDVDPPTIITGQF